MGIMTTTPADIRFRRNARVRDLMDSRGIRLDPSLIPPLTEAVEQTEQMALRLRREPPVAPEDISTPFDLTRFLETEFCHSGKSRNPSHSQRDGG
jgi:hypothetical protein